jgi:hypothetical protein
MRAHVASKTLRLIPALALAVCQYGCVSLLDCSTRDVATEYSPSRGFAARTYVVDCGATTAVAIHVAIYRAGSSAKRSEDVFIYEGDVSDVDVIWTSTSELLIKYRIGKVFKNDGFIDGVTVKYLHP